ncbi:FAD/NAD(P)-binding protein [Pedobacter cryoconitis]|uniref:Putative NAD(P)/FAD-binding protein YdhS n=1 Tax=Pedobacter cryoconitis TaxID=188932 RepID=A0A7X0J534_9SPHI|nr:FAD/NAD(P)-binding protein [Pedobacter cryoconitis]MBB6501299.1 putative NAD(P)/FAD-binding protein YdhS [Pedobacter cryoconitis]
MKNIVIIGGGLSGYLLLINLLRFCPNEELKVIMMEKEAVDRLGVPYSTEDEDHLLNVPACNMSAFSDKKEHFTDWLYRKSFIYSATSFVPRKIYRLYILDIFNRLMEAKASTINVTRLRVEAVDVDMVNKLVLTNQETAVPFDQLVLATGTFAANHLPLHDKTYMQTAGYFHSAWDNSWANHIQGNETVVMIGTGLTMTDTLISLQKTRHNGKAIALSRHGLLPSMHKNYEPYPDFRGEMQAVKTALGMLQVVRSHLRKAKHSGSDWRAVIDVLRPCTSQLWQQLPYAERRAFMEHLRHYWDVCRHRMPETCADIVSAALLKEQVRIQAGRITGIQVTAEGRFKITIRKQGGKEIQQITADIIINCMGPSTNYNRISQVLIQNLLQKRLICADPLCLGILCDEEGALIQEDGYASDCFHTLGAPAKGILWETTAVPEIRIQAHYLAHKMLKLVKKNIVENVIR